jgi:hypothetical protein
VGIASPQSLDEENYLGRQCKPHPQTTGLLREKVTDGEKRRARVVEECGELSVQHTKARKITPWDEVRGEMC